LILSQGSLPSTDIYQAMTPPRSWCTFQWLYEVILALVEPILELRGIRWMHAIVAALGLWLWSLNLGRAMKLRGSVFLILASVLLFLYTDRIRVRPHVFNLLLIGALIPSLTEPQRVRSLLGKAVTISMIALLANIHAGGGLIALCLLIASSTGVIFSPRNPVEERRDAGIFLSAAIGVTLLMPGFLRGTIQALEMEGSTRDLFLEWQPPLVYLTLPAADALTVVHHYVLGLSPYLCTLALASLLIRRIFRDGIYNILADPRLPAITLALGASILAMRSARFVHYAVLMLPGLQALATDLSFSWKPLQSPRKWIATGLAVGLVLICYQYRVATLAPGGDALSRWFNWDLTPGAFPEKAAEFMAENKLEGGVYNISAHHGSYLIGKLYPAIKVHYDGRGNLSSREASAIAFLTYERWKPEALEQVLEVYNNSGLDYILTPPPAFPKGSQPPGFRLLFRDRVAELWQRTPTTQP